MACTHCHSTALEWLDKFKAKCLLCGAILLIVPVLLHREPHVPHEMPGTIQIKTTQTASEASVSDSGRSMMLPQGFTALWPDDSG